MPLYAEIVVNNQPINFSKYPTTKTKFGCSASYGVCVNRDFVDLRTDIPEMWTRNGPRSMHSHVEDSTHTFNIFSDENRPNRSGPRHDSRNEEKNCRKYTRELA